MPLARRRRQLPQMNFNFGDRIFTFSFRFALANRSVGELLRENKLKFRLVSGTFPAFEINFSLLAK